MKILILLTLILSSCSSFDNFIKTTKVHDKMATQLDSNPYEMSLPELQKKVTAYLEEEKIFGHRWVGVSTTTLGPQNTGSQEVIDAMADGFIYKNNLYTSTVDIDFGLIGKDAEALKKHFFKGRFHTLESDPQSFMIVKHDNIYEGVKDGEGKSFLRIHKLQNVVQPISWNIDWIDLLRRKNSFLSFARGAVDLETSRKYQTRNRALELSMFFAIDESRANKIEQELLSSM